MDFLSLGFADIFFFFLRVLRFIFFIYISGVIVIGIPWMLICGVKDLIEDRKDSMANQKNAGTPTHH